VTRPALALAAVLLAACAPAVPSAPKPPAPDKGPTVDVTGRKRPEAGRSGSPAPVLGNGELLSLSELEALGHGIVATAREEMGRPYRLGGTGGDAGEGFDCSGLIQYAYQQHGIALPRVSTDQAQAGVGIPREVEQLVPGDLLTFSRKAGGTTVSHVGMYVGDGRFIHSSSSRGVTESALTNDDPEGRWWVKRWVGVRRILGY
jgi:cell wall-associated NlpC family hydrolase